MRLLWEFEEITTMESWKHCSCMLNGVWVCIPRADSELWQGVLALPDYFWKLSPWRHAFARSHAGCHPKLGRCSPESGELQTLCYPRNACFYERECSDAPLGPSTAIMVPCLTYPLTSLRICLPPMDALTLSKDRLKLRPAEWLSLLKNNKELKNRCQALIAKSVSVSQCIDRCVERSTSRVQPCEVLQVNYTSTCMIFHTRKPNKERQQLPRILGWQTPKAKRKHTVPSRV